MTSQVRRVLTGHDESGRSIFIADAPCTNTISPPALHGVTIAHLWETSGEPVDVRANDDRGRGAITLKPPRNGTLFRVVDFPPDRLGSDAAGAAETHAEFAALGGASGDEATPAQPMMHQTATIDYAIVLSGECYLVLDEGEVLLRAGDTAIQRGVNHAWSNRSSEVCRIAFVMIDAAGE